MQQKKVFVIILLMICGFIFSCKKENEMQKSLVSYNSSADTPLLRTLYDAGITPSAIKDKGEFYVVGGDLAFKKHQTDLALVKKYYSCITYDSVPKTEQWRTPTTVLTSKIDIIKVGVHSSIFSTWAEAVNQGLAYWASVPNCKLNFATVYDASLNDVVRDITITNDGGILDDDVIARAEFPSNGNPGFQIIINTDFLSGMNVPYSTKVYNIVHEIGHCIGLRHSNWQARGEAANGTSLIPNTPSVDANSVMNGGTALFTWNGFSTYDMAAVQYLYPYQTYDNWLTAPGGKFTYQNNIIGPYLQFSPGTPITITWNSALVTTPTVTLELYQDGVYKHTLGTNVPNTGSYSAVVDPYLSGSRYNFLVQIRITSDANPAIFDVSSFFYNVLPD